MFGFRWFHVHQVYFPPVRGFGLFILEELKADITHEWMHGVVVLTKLISCVAYLSTATTLMADMVWSHIIPATVTVAQDVYWCLTAD